MDYAALDVNKFDDGYWVLALIGSLSRKVTGNPTSSDYGLTNGCVSFRALESVFRLNLPSSSSSSYP
ncbi:hypothetical protein ABKN59_010465 [Abortiporus biennis]